jgi:hypothetical protein
VREFLPRTVPPQDYGLSQNYVRFEDGQQQMQSPKHQQPLPPPGISFKIPSSNCFYFILKFCLFLQKRVHSRINEYTFAKKKIQNIAEADIINRMICASLVCFFMCAYLTVNILHEWFRVYDAMCIYICLWNPSSSYFHLT